MGRRAKFSEDLHPMVHPEDVRTLAAWRERAACLGQAEPGYDPWHPEAPGKAEDTAEAVGICSACPVRRECLTDALFVERGRSAFYRYGIWGGMTPEQRAGVGFGKVSA